MNNTYLIFFGKSQDFTFHAFDSVGYLGRNFENIIKDFDELESKVFTTDDISNRQILSKYNFEKNGKQYSLLKLYSLAQAFNGNRIDGSIYGVAILSENDLKISESNINILKASKEEFAKLTLDGVKFKMSDFFNAVEKIWIALKNHENGNYLEKIEFNNHTILNINRNLKAYWVKDILKQPLELNEEIFKTSRLYFSDDLAHLKRTQDRRGKDVFSIYYKENNVYVPYLEKKQAKGQLPQIGDTGGSKDLLLENGRLNRQIDDTDRKFLKFRQESAKKIRLLSITTVIFCLMALIFFFKDMLSNTQQNTETDAAYNTYDNNAESVTSGRNNLQDSVVDINNILVDDNKRIILSTLLQNIKQAKGSTSERLYNAIKRDIDSLGINKSIADKYKPDQNRTQDINSETNNQPNNSNNGADKQQPNKKNNGGKTISGKDKNSGQPKQSNDSTNNIQHL